MEMEVSEWSRIVYTGTKWCQSDSNFFIFAAVRLFWPNFFMLAAKIANFLVLHTDFGQWGGKFWRVKGWIFRSEEIIHFLPSRGDLPILPLGEQSLETNRNRYHWYHYIFISAASIPEVLCERQLLNCSITLLLSITPIILILTDGRNGPRYILSS